MNLLPDTSIWIDYLRGRDSAKVAEMHSIPGARVRLHVRPVMAELLAGTHPDRRGDLWLAIGSLPWTEIDQPAWRSIGEVGNDLRRAGVSVPFTDIVIAVAATAAEAALWTNDRDFERIQQALPDLELHST